MPSCSSSSNIQGTSTLLNPTGSESRLSIKLLKSAAGGANGYTIDSNVFAGGVVRYSPLDKTYFLSQANNNENAEVVGVVESIDSNGDAIVVLRGLIEYPSGATLNSISSGGVAGGSGGSDIWFLSAATAGEMQNLEPDAVSQIAKPVMQTIASSNDYNYQVLNYIGYAIGGEIVGSGEQRLPIGTSLIVPDDVTLPTGWISAEKEKEIVVTEYPEYYSYVGKTNGYVEKITLSSSPPASLRGRGYVQKDAGSISTSGRILKVDTVNKEIFVKKTASQSATSVSTPISVGNVSYGTPASVEVYSVLSPKVTPGLNSSFSYYENGRVVDKKQKVIIKIQDVIGVSVPAFVTVKEMFVSDKLTAGNSGISYSDVADELTKIKSRLTTLETKVIGRS